MFGIPAAVIWIIAILSTVYNVMSTAQKKSQAADARRSAIQDYYRQLQKGQTESRVFKSSQASTRDMRLQARRFTQASEQLVEEAAAREKFSQTQRSKEAQYRDLKARQIMFDNKYSTKRSLFMPSPEGGKETDVLLAQENFGELTGIFSTQIDVEIFNNNYFGEA